MLLHPSTMVVYSVTKTTSKIMDFGYFFMRICYPDLFCRLSGWYLALWLECIKCIYSLKRDDALLSPFHQLCRTVIERTFNKLTSGHLICNYVMLSCIYYIVVLVWQGQQLWGEVCTSRYTAYVWRAQYWNKLWN